MVRARIIHSIALPLLMFNLFCYVTAASAGDRRMEILGYLEHARLIPGDLEIRAKLDTGADTSSLNAPDVEEFERDDDTWVRFSVENDDGDNQEFEAPVTRMVRIRSASGTDRRYVVRMNICLGTILREVEVNLADRSDLSYQMLIGRSYMEDHVLVDSGREYTVDPDCDMDAEPEKIDDSDADGKDEDAIEEENHEQEVE